GARAHIRGCRANFMTQPEGMAPGTGTAKPLIGLAGGIGSGKSTVASILKDLGAAVISSDALNREALETPTVREALRGWWGDSVFRSDGRVDRPAIRQRIAGHAEARRRLER